MEILELLDTTDGFNNCILIKGVISLKISLKFDEQSQFYGIFSLARDEVQKNNRKNKFCILLPLFPGLL